MQVHRAITKDRQRFCGHTAHVKTIFKFLKGNGKKERRKILHFSKKHENILYILIAQ
ncbi:hypothetical protein HMPREF0530_1053 [Lacticaseibacillus paracasei subsp. paracasei ATCC 25302 = DSM 5622 = JCM 8130]|nr:hypothetical protein HMPREF0530_1053 [Lacticaseibacillus paracasei subsp. paracasei ATCC 25302 = DSM 5622 = JCM 8130]